MQLLVHNLAHAAKNTEGRSVQEKMISYLLADPFFYSSSFSSSSSRPLLSEDLKMFPENKHESVLMFIKAEILSDSKSH